MKITEIRTIVVGNPWKNWVFVVVETSDGISGLGEATGGLQTMPNKEAVEEIKHLAIGKNPLEISNVVDEMYKASFLKITPAISAIEIACWDILGQHLKVPIYQLLGGKVRDKVRVYANGWYSGERTPENFGDKAKAIQVCVNRFDDETKQAFLELYDKVDADFDIDKLEDKMYD